MRLAIDQNLAAAMRNGFLIAALLSLHHLTKSGWLGAAGVFLAMFALLTPCLYLQILDQDRKRRADEMRRLLERERAAP